MNDTIKGKALLPGATIGVLACGSPATPERFQQGVAELERRGFSVSYPLDSSTVLEYGFGCGSKEDRAQALMELIENDEVSAILAVRGGYGSIDLLPLLDFKSIRKHPKPIVGYSDVTVLLANITEKSCVATIHGATVAAEFARAAQSDEAKISVDGLLSMLTDPSFRPKYSCEILRDGEARGRVLAGNLTMLLTLLGTPWDVSYEGAILVLEDVGEAPYRVHRALNQLKMAGKLNKLAGVVLGRFNKCEADSGPTVEEVLRKSVSDIFTGTKFPILLGLEFGHHGKNVAMPLGCQAEISKGMLSVKESPVS